MGSLAEEIEADEHQLAVQELEEQLTRVKSELATVKKDHRATLKTNAELRELLDVIQQIEQAHSKPPAWALPKRRKKAHSGIPCLFLSDLHLDEVVEPEEVEGLNAYDRDIAKMRLEKCVENTIMLCRDYFHGLNYDGFYLLLGGDNISGWIHEELVETNEATVPDTVAWWLDPLSAAIGTLVDEFEKVHVVGVVGNHGRTTKKPRAKKRVTDNIDWLIYRLLERDFRDDSRITWQVPESADTTVPIYNTDFLLTHGDQFRGGSGISGLLAPMMTGVYKKSKRAMQTDTSFDYLVCGHWHQLSFFKNIIVNGALKGYDEFAYQGNFEFEEPRQALWVVTPERGITMHTEVYVQDQKKEGW